MAKFCGNCGKPLDLHTGRCAACDASSGKSGLPIWWIVGMAILIGVLVVLLLVVIVYTQTEEIPDGMAAVELTVINENGQRIDEYFLLVDSTDDAQAYHLEKTDEQIKDEGLYLPPGSYQMTAIPDDAPDTMYISYVTIVRPGVPFDVTINQNGATVEQDVPTEEKTDTENKNDAVNSASLYDEVMTSYSVVEEGTQTLNSDKPFDHAGWTERNGLISASQTDMDGDDTEELILLSLEGENCIIELYTEKNGEAVAVGTQTIPYMLYMLDLDGQRFAAYMMPVDGVMSLCIENCGGCMMASVGFQMRYYVFQYVNGTLHKRMVIENEVIGSGEEKYVKKTYDDNGEETYEIISGSYYDETKNGFVDTGTHYGKEQFEYYALIEEGFPEESPIPVSNAYFGDGTYMDVTTYFDHKTAQKACFIVTEDGPISTYTDYSGLH